MIDLGKLDRPPAGFAACAQCAYRQHGSPPICFTCAAEHTEPISQNACPICAQERTMNGACANPVCNWDDRYFDMVWAISMRTGQMKSAISRYKYDGKYGWAGIFGRILVGFLNERAADFDDFDAIIPSPTGARPEWARWFSLASRGRVADRARLRAPQASRSAR